VYVAGGGQGAVTAVRLGGGGRASRVLRRLVVADGGRAIVSLAYAAFTATGQAAPQLLVASSDGSVRLLGLARFQRDRLARVSAAAAAAAAAAGTVAPKPKPWGPAPQFSVDASVAVHAAGGTGAAVFCPLLSMERGTALGTPIVVDRACICVSALVRAVCVHRRTCCMFMLVNMCVFACAYVVLFADARAYDPIFAGWDSVCGR
jgi:hypothetical protein